MNPREPPLGGEGPSDETPFLIVAAAAAFQPSFAAFTDQGPPPPNVPAATVTYRTEQRLVRLVESGWSTNDFLVGSDGSRRFIGGSDGDWSDYGIEAFVSIVLGMTPAQAKADCEKSGRIMCCGTETMPPCGNFCWCNSTFTGNESGGGVSSCFCVCADSDGDSTCPPYPNQFAW